jgi:membrane protein
MYLKACQKKQNQQNGFCRALHILKAIIHDIAEGGLTLRAAGLVYISFLSIVPLLAFSFSVLKAFGVHNAMEPLLLQLLEPLGDKGIEITSRITEFVSNMKVATLGTFGLIILLYTIFALTSRMEDAFNHTWRVPNNRNFLDRFTRYLSIIVVAPILMFSALGISASISHSHWFQDANQISFASDILKYLAFISPKLLIIMAFSFAYWFIPNTQVKFKSALIGGLFAGTLWIVAGWGFASYVSNATQQVAIYSVFASLLFFIIWINVGWLILLIGSSIACYVQHSEYAFYRQDKLELASRDRERLAILLLKTIAQRYYAKQAPYTLDELQQQLQIPSLVIEPLLNTLQRHQFITRDAADETHYLPLSPMSETTIEQVIKAIRAGNEEQIQLGRSMLHDFPEVEPSQTTIKALLQKSDST